MSWKLKWDGTNTAISDQWDVLDINTWIMTLWTGEVIQTLPVSEAAQEWAEEWLRILEWGEEV